MKDQLEAVLADCNEDERMRVAYIASVVMERDWEREENLEILRNAREFQPLPVPDDPARISGMRL